MSKNLTVVEQKTIEFYDDELIAVRAEDGHIYVGIRQMCTALGLDQRSQRRQIQNHEILAEGYQRGVVSTPHRGHQQAGMIRADLVPLWLSGIQTAKVKEDIRPKLQRFQKEAAKVLWEAFQEGRLTSVPSFDDLLEKDSPAVQAYKTFVALTQLARNQVMLEARLDDYGERLERIESTLGDPGRDITPDQASQISQAVKAVAIVLSKQTKRNEFGAVYGEFYRKFGVTSYKKLPVDRFDEAMEFLAEWHQSLVSDAPF